MWERQQTTQYSVGKTRARRKKAEDAHKEASDEADLRLEHALEEIDRKQDEDDNDEDRDDVHSGPSRSDSGLARQSPEALTIKLLRYGDLRVKASLR